MKKMIPLLAFMFLVNLIFLAYPSLVFAKLWKCEEVFGFSSLHKEIIFYDSDIGVCFGDAALAYEINEKNYSVENIFAGAKIGDLFLALAGFIREADGNNFLAPNAFLFQKQQDGTMRGWHFFIPDGLRKPVKKFLPDIKTSEINYVFRNRLVALFVRAGHMPENAGEMELEAVLKPYFEYISKTTNIECEDKEKNV